MLSKIRESVWDSKMEWSREERYTRLEDVSEAYISELTKKSQCGSLSAKISYSTKNRIIE